jgi:hypothetical protein
LKTAEVKKAAPIISIDGVVGINVNTAGAKNLSPIIAQGDGQGQRNGNSVTLKSVWLGYRINCNEHASTTSPTDFSFFLWKNKSGISVPAGMGDFLQVGNTATDFSGDLKPYSNLLTVNADQYSLKKNWIHKLWHPSSSSHAAAANVEQSAMGRIDITSFYKKTLVYDDTDTLPTNDALFLNVASVQADGGTIAGYTGLLTYVVEFEYYDM